MTLDHLSSVGLQNKPITLTETVFLSWLLDKQHRPIRAVITPALAEVMLKYNKRNRQLKKGAIDKLVKDMKTGRWKYNGEPITFNNAQQLHDGQHRLKACILSGVNIEVLLVFGLDKDTIDTVNRGASRTVSDHLQMMSRSNTLALAAALGYMWRYENDVMANLAFPMQTYEAEEVLNRHPLLDTYVAKCSKDMRELINPSMYSFCRTAFESIDKAKSDEFFAKVISGLFQKEHDPVRRLRDRLMKQISKKEHLSRLETLALIIKAWNFHLEGEDCKLLKWQSGGNEPFPSILGSEVGLAA